MPSRMSLAVARIRLEIQRLIESSSSSRASLGAVCGRIATLVNESLRAIGERSSPGSTGTPLHEAIEELRTSIDNACVSSAQEQPTSVQVEVPPSAEVPRVEDCSLPDRNRRILFSPQPGVSDANLRRHWQVQLLLLLAMRDSNGPARVAQLLNDDEASLHDAATRAAQTVEHWSPQTFLHRLMQAITLLEWDDPPVCLKGRLLRQGDRQVGLSVQQARFISCLADSFEEFVEPETFRRTGISNPVKIRSKLAAKLKDAEIQLTIVEDGGRYRLVGNNVRISAVPPVQ